ncbi:MAG TPA: hypothetical protein PK625_01295 [Spirochaetales bacterium]|nr:hypothetical protein [Spirochaetales bacterium]
MKAFSVVLRRCLAAALVLGLASCSSAPKRQAAVVEKKNEAAEYLALADGFYFLGQYASAVQYYTEALDANLSVDNVEGSIKARNSLGRSFMALGRLDDAAREFGDALTDARAYGKAALIALGLSNLGELAHRRGDLESADLFFSDAEGLAPSGDPVWAVVAHNIGVTAMARGDLETAYDYVLKAESANERAKLWVELGSNRYVLASITNAQGRTADALTWALRALAADKTAENTLGIGSDLEALGSLKRKAGLENDAFNFYRRAFGLWVAMNRVDDARRCLVVLIELAANTGRDDYAQRYKAILDSIAGTE